MPTTRKNPSARKRSQRRRALDASKTVVALDLSQAARQDELRIYRERISDLEATIERFRDHFVSLNSSVANLSESRAHFCELFEQSPVAYFVHDANGFIAEVNKAGESLLGLRHSERGQACIAQFLTERQLLAWLNHIRECTKSRQQTITELTLRIKGRNIRQVQLVTVPAPVPFPGKPLRFHTAVIDISSHRQAELALNQTYQNYQRLIDMIEGIVWEADARSLRFLYVSRYAERLLGYSLSAWTEPSFWETHIYAEDRERVLNAINEAVTRQRDVPLDYRVIAADRRIVWLHDSITVVQTMGLSRLFGVAIDVTEQRNAEQQMRLAHISLEAKVAERTAELRKTVTELEAFSYSLSHDMRAPIRAMRGYAELLDHFIGGKLGPKPPEFLHRIMSSAERLDLLVQDVLQFNRVARAPLEMRPVPLDGLVNNILHDYPTLARDKARIEIRQPLLPIRGHEAFVGQALSNLLTNAVKFVPPGRIPEVRLWTEEVSYNGTANSAQETGADRWVRIWVEDNGLGIASADQKRIFRMFERVYSSQEFEGTGIGLAIVQKAIERMGGNIGLESSLGQGSRFWIELPLA